MHIPGQAIASPVVTTTLYLFVFGWGPAARPAVDGIEYSRFLIPGLVMLGVVNNAFSNSVSSLFMAKLQGTVVDLLVAPLSPWDVWWGYVGAAMVRAYVVGGAIWAVAALLTGPTVAHPLWALMGVGVVGALFGGLGVLVALWADKFEQVNVVPTFVLTPLTFLGGVFYSVDQLPGVVGRLALLNPVLFMVELLRFAILDRSSLRPGLCLGAVVVLTAAVALLGVRLLSRGYKLRT